MDQANDGSDHPVDGDPSGPATGVTRRPSTSSKNPWSVRADEVLADGLWHSGRTFSMEVEKVILPGVALRLNESLRNSAHRHQTPPPDRKVERGTDTLIAMGRRAIIQGLVHARVRSGSWQVRPWPIPEQGWSTSQWEVRDLRAIRVSLTVVAGQVGLSLNRLREVVLRDPPLAHERVGRVLYLYDFAGLAERVQLAKEESAQRRGEASRVSAAARRTRPPTKLSLTQLAGRNCLSVDTVRRLADGAPELGWQHVGSVTYLPIDELPSWDEVVALYRADTSLRRSAASRLARARRRARLADGVPLPSPGD